MHRGTPSTVPGLKALEEPARLLRLQLQPSLGLVQSLNRPREITDNVHMESFFHSRKSDTVPGVTFASDAQLMSRPRSSIPY